ncbi:MAG: glycosyltransferase family 2 protein [Bacteroidetes bacterium]|nr:glycosyltransferase family 2 protein [Bacteroidota bacterium]
MNDRIPASLLTAVILTWNEEENIGRTLSHLGWLEKVIVVDSNSTDKTIELIRSFPNAEIYQRKFDTHATQWNYGLGLCESEWVLSLDADYILNEGFINETLEFLETDTNIAYRAFFEFCVFGKPLRSNNTTPRPVLFKKEFCKYYDDGHTQRLKINGQMGTYKNKIWHDDRKPLLRWLINQSFYSEKESEMLLNAPPDILSFPSKLRKTKILAPLLIFVYSLFIKRLILDGWHGWHYTLQRTIAESLICMRLIEDKYKDFENPDENNLTS